jgi:hypothetical protein
MTDAVYSGLASHTGLLPMWALYFQSLTQWSFGNRFAFSNCVTRRTESIGSESRRRKL